MGAFVLAIVSTLISFLTSQYGLEKQSRQVVEELESINDNEAAYTGDDETEEKNNEKDPSDLPFNITKWLSWGSVTFYIAAILFTVCFVKSNIVFTKPN